VKNTALCFFLLAAGVIPANADDPCPQILAGGIWENRDSTEKAVDNKSFLNWVCSKRSEDDSGGGGYAAYYGNAKYQMSKEDCSSNKGATFISKDFKQTMRTEAPKAIEAWRACINRNGSYASILYTDDPNIFAIYFHTHFPNSNHGEAKITMRPLNAIECDRTKVAYNNEFSISCQRRNARQTVQVTVNFPGETTYLSISRTRDAPKTVAAVRICRHTWGGGEGPDCLDTNVQRANVYTPNGISTGADLDECVVKGRADGASDVRTGCQDSTGRRDYACSRFTIGPDFDKNIPRDRPAQFFPRLMTCWGK